LINIFPANGIAVMA